MKLKMKHLQTLLLSGMILLSACNQENKIVYPATEKDNTVDNYFGVEVPDPYRWLENDTSAATAAWVEAENRITNEYLSKIPFRDKLKQRMTDLLNYERIGLPYKKDGKYYFSKNDGLQNQSVLYVKDSLEGEPVVLLDPNTLSEDGTVALAGYHFSNNGKYMAYTVSRSGSDWNEIYVIDLATRKHLDDHILWAKFTDASWKGEGFFYSAYDAPVAGKEFSNVNENHKIYYHTLGDPQSKDVLVFQNPKAPKRFYGSVVSEDERLQFIIESGAGSGNNLLMKNLTQTGAPVVALTDNMDYSYYPVEVIGNTIFLLTNYQAPKYRLMTANIASPKLNDWKELIPETESVLDNARIMDGHLILTYQQDVSKHAFVFTLDGKPLHEIAFPTLGSVAFGGDKDDKEIFYSFASYTYPTTIFKYDLATNQSELYMAPKIAFQPEEYVTEQVFYASKDGTKIPMFLVYKKGLKKNGKNPVFLYGYGGFNVSLTPRFSTSYLTFLENGGVYALTNLRGGGEYGEDWHLAGTQLKKQNVFDDFIAAAEYLIQENYTNKEKLAINGASNGGLLVGAVVNQRPDLFKVAVPQVGVMDMLRYHTFTIGWNWASDYGTSADSAEMFNYLYAYSPLHTIRNDGTSYPAILITTADHDDRVVPAHSFKYAAALQAANTGSAPKLIRIESKAGHGSGKPIAKIIEESVDMYAFVMYNLGMTMK